MEYYKVQITKDCKRETISIYHYISNVLGSTGAAKKLINNVKTEVLLLEKSAHLYMKISDEYNLKKEYGRIRIKNYIIVYTIDEEKKKVYIVHMFYGRQNYFKFLD